MSPEGVPNYSSKFTKGEKCILYHMCVTFALILILAIVFLIHLCVVRHGSGQIFSVTRKHMDSRIKGWESVGAVCFRGNRTLCGSVLVRKMWSLTPAHCVVARANPTLANLLPFWAIAYLHPDPADTAIVRGLVHSQFNKDDGQNNVGLFEHKVPILISDLTISPIHVSDDMLLTFTTTAMSLVMSAGKTVLNQVEVSAITHKNCRHLVSPITELRPYEFCTILSPRTGLPLDHGAALVIDSEVRGFFTWGDRRGHLPLVILDISYFKKWIDFTISD